jgi:hypothetical protein
MIRRWCYILICSILLPLWLVGCNSRTENTPMPTSQPLASPSIIVVSSYTPAPNKTVVGMPAGATRTSVRTDPVPKSIMIPTDTLTPQETENHLLDLLRTNGDCKGKCVGGIYPDEMNLQEAVNQLAQWGRVRSYQNPKNEFFYRLDQQSQDGKVWVQISIGPGTEEQSAVNSIGMRVTGTSDSYIDSEAWQANRTSWHAFHLDGILTAYGVPSEVRFHFSTDVKGKWLEEGRTIFYWMHLSYQALNMVVDLSGLAREDKGEIFLCPAIDPHYLDIEYNPNLDQEKIATFLPVTWQELMGVDNLTFYQQFSDQKNWPACITTTVNQILSIDPYFR